MNNLKLITKDQKLGFCLVSVAPVRIDGRDSSEIVSQLLFGEPIEVLEFGEPWLKIRTIHDGYEGFVDIKHVLPLTEKEFNRWLSGFIYQKELHQQIITPWGKQLISRGSFVSSEETFKIGSFNFTQKIVDNETKKSFIELTKELTNTPYLWGGKSVFGIDCSGFVQMIFRLFDLNLPRDAYQQAEIGELIGFNEIKPGDLAYFVNANGKIIHVGIIIENSQIIHASGRLRIDQFTETGIFNSDYNKETHQLHFVKRVLNEIH
jgi:cell wall-associated NlpC family hydrolase